MRVFGQGDVVDMTMKMASGKTIVTTVVNDQNHNRLWNIWPVALNIGRSSSRWPARIFGHFIVSISFVHSVWIRVHRVPVSIGEELFDTEDTRWVEDWDTEQKYKHYLCQPELLKMTKNDKKFPFPDTAGACWLPSLEWLRVAPLPRDSSHALYYGYIHVDWVLNFFSGIFLYGL